jgi:hypothetical protein
LYRFECYSEEAKERLTAMGIEAEKIKVAPENYYY